MVVRNLITGGSSQFLDVYNPTIYTLNEIIGYYFDLKLSNRNIRKCNYINIDFISIWILKEAITK